MGKTAKTLIFPLIFLFFLWLIFGYPFFWRRLIPAPLDFLTNFYNPWRAYQAFPIKNPAIPDVVSQILPWNIYNFKQIKEGNLPLWNPYNFAGTPHLANFQSAVFSPFKILFLIFDFLTAWSLFILFQPLLAGFFTYLYCQKIGLKVYASLMGAVSFAFGGFLTVWLEYGTLGWAILWLPFSLYLWEVFFEKNKTIYLVFLNLVIAFSLLSGHLQISLYLMFTNFLYLLYNLFQKKVKLKIFFLSLLNFIFPFLITAFQLWPTLEFYLYSPRSQQVPVDWYKNHQMPPSQLLTFIFPDFFGHPATRNLWGKGSYVEMMGYAGFLSFFLATFYLLNDKNSKNKKSGKFFILLLLISLVLSLPTPLSDLIVYLKIPVFSSSAPSRIICLANFSLAILAAFGLEEFLKILKTNSQKIKNFLIKSLISLSIFESIVYFFNKIAFRNTLFLFAIFLVFNFFILFYILFLKEKFKLKKIFLLKTLIILLVFIDLFRFWHKFVSFSKKEDFFPSLALINFLKQNQQIYRSFGLLEDNLNLPFAVYSTTGYDSLLILDYQKLIKAAENGFDILPSRVTGEKIGSRGKYSRQLLDLLGVKYVIVGRGDLFAFPTWEYPESFEKVWEDKNFYIFENKNVWPRFFLTNKFKVVSSSDFLTQALKGEKETLILTQDPQLSNLNSEGKKEIELMNYQPHLVKFKIETEEETLFFLSDAFYPGWKAKIDNKEVEILKANFAFRALKVPKGKHELVFIYSPASFYNGVKLSLISLFFMFVILFKFNYFNKNESLSL